MTVGEIIVALFGGGAIGAIINVWSTRKKDSENHRVDLLDRSYTEISRLENNNRALEADNKNLRQVLFDEKLRYSELNAEYADLKEDYEELKERNK